MFKIFRIVRVLKHFRELRLMLSALLGSLTTFFWCIVMLGFVLALCGLVFMQAAVSLLHDAENSLVPRAEVDAALEYWGSLPKAVNSMFLSITGGGDWEVYASPLWEAGWHFYILFEFAISFLVLAVLNVLTGTFCANAVSAAIRDHENVAYIAAKEHDDFKNEIKMLFEVMDEDHSGTICWSEFHHHAENPKMLAYLRALEIDPKDVEFFFLLLSQHAPDGEVSVDMFLDGCQRLKGDAKMIDIQSLAAQLRVLHSAQERHIRLTETMFTELIAILGDEASSPLCQQAAI